MSLGRQEPRGAGAAHVYEKCEGGGWVACRPGSGRLLGSEHVTLCGLNAATRDMAAMAEAVRCAASKWSTKKVCTITRRGPVRDRRARRVRFGPRSGRFGPNRLERRRTNATRRTDASAARVASTMRLITTPHDSTRPGRRDSEGAMSRCTPKPPVAMASTHRRCTSTSSMRVPSIAIVKLDQKVHTL